MATSTRGRSQDRAKVAGGQDQEVRYKATKTGQVGGESVAPAAIRSRTS